ncbi:MAG: hypothetical protein NXI18_19235, partial [Alphaproteobacteria bacterium]|nr:hypothetical protein [Alphaproteobacteria bacterium]
IEGGSKQRHSAPDVWRTRTKPHSIIKQEPDPPLQNELDWPNYPDDGQWLPMNPQPAGHQNSHKTLLPLCLGTASVFGETTKSDHPEPFRGA